MIRIPTINKVIFKVKGLMDINLRFRSEIQYICLDESACRRKKDRENLKGAGRLLSDPNDGSYQEGGRMDALCNADRSVRPGSIYRFASPETAGRRRIADHGEGWPKYVVQDQ